MTKKHTTLLEVARAIGIHVSTVSRVLNGSPAEAGLAASAETVERIRQIAKSLDYHPNHLARSLKSQRSRMVGVLMPGVTDLVLAQIYEAIEIEGAHFGYESIVANTHDQTELQATRSAVLLDRRVDGLILGDVPWDGGYAHHLCARKVPLVLVSRFAADFPYVVADDFGGGHAMAHHFADLGHQRVAVLAGRTRSSTGRERTRGFIQGMAERGAVVDPDSVVYTEFTTESGYAAALSLLQAKPDITAVFACNDYDALGVFGAARELGRTPGLDLAIGGFNNIALTEHLTIPLTTVHSPRREMGQLAMQMLINIIEGRSNGEQVVLPTHLVVRASSCRVPSLKLKKKPRP